MIREDSMSKEALIITRDTLSQALGWIEFRRVKPKPMKVRGQTIHTEAELFEMYSADLFNYTQYSKYLEKFRAKNASADKYIKDLNDAEEYIKMIRRNISAYIREKE